MTRNRPWLAGIPRLMDQRGRELDQLIRRLHSSSDGPQNDPDEITDRARTDRPGDNTEEK